MIGWKPLSPVGSLGGKTFGWTFFDACVIIEVNLCFSASNEWATLVFLLEKNPGAFFSGPGVPVVCLRIVVVQRFGWQTPITLGPAWLAFEPNLCDAKLDWWLYSQTILEQILDDETYFLT